MSRCTCILPLPGMPLQCGTMTKKKGEELSKDTRGIQVCCGTVKEGIW